MFYLIIITVILNIVHSTYGLVCVCVYFVQLSLNPLTNVGALTLLTTVENNKNSAVEEIDISVSAAKT